MLCNTHYDSFRTRTFTNIFPDETTFLSTWNSSPISSLSGLVDTDKIKLIYYLLYARYGNSHIAFTDENQFKYALLSTIFMYGPSWVKRLEIQTNLRNLTEDDITRGGKAIYNQSLNPSTAPSTSTLEELTTINAQNTTNYKKSKLEGYSMLMSLIETDVTEEFIGKFKKLFLTVVASGEPLLYATYNVQED